MTSGKTITVDSDGDLLILLGPVEAEKPTLVLTSSKHMTLASRTFKTMLHSDFQEGTQLKATGKLDLPLPDDNPEAMLILINIVHNRPKFVPLKVSLETFTEIAILVDKYEMHDSLHILLPIWRKELEGSIISGTVHESGWSNVLRWLCASWVFGLARDFTVTTKLIQTQSEEDLGQLLKKNNVEELPIPQTVIDYIETNRQNQIRQAAESLELMILRYRGTTRKCVAEMQAPPTNGISSTFSIETKHDLIFVPNARYLAAMAKAQEQYRLSTQFLLRHSSFTYPSEEKLKHDAHLAQTKLERARCDSMVFGSLVKSACSYGIYPFPAAPYTGLSIARLRNMIGHFDIHSLCMHSSNQSHPDDNHGVKPELLQKLQAIENAHSGLKLEDI